MTFETDRIRWRLMNARITDLGIFFLAGIASDMIAVARDAHNLIHRAGQQQQDHRFFVETLAPYLLRAPRSHA